MDNSLIMRIDTPYVLNYLIYLQNIYLNQKQREEQLKFPYFSEMIMFNANFEMQFKELWDDVLNRISRDEGNSIDIKIFHEESYLFYKKLLIHNSDSLKIYNEIYKGFRVWWSSLAGSFSVERSIDDPSNHLYDELTNYLRKNEIEPKKQLNISLIYDECLLANTGGYSYSAVHSIKDFIVNKEELLLKLQNCIC
ncbi:hypothetical protein [Paucisalibacillus sp. EB02]|uniref:hypothetical protein n=1 Tax=Paucisalibacillus sp. EB02 TaxID=1347087 RepID=UPI0004AFEB6F|nr:hypothetical protein [Paucisalibacillus sp. EB02]